MFGRTHHRVRGLKLLSKSITLKQAFWPAFVLPRNRSNGNAASVLPPVYGIVTEGPAVPDADTMIKLETGWAEPACGPLCVLAVTREPTGLFVTWCTCIFAWAGAPVMVSW